MASPAPRFSFIVATVGRTSELVTLLGSIRKQGRSDIEILLVDQNEDDRIARLIQAEATTLPVVHLRTAIRNVSAARNTGLAAARGEIVAFPDDDCWYPEGLLDQVDSWFVAHPQYAVLATGAVDDEGLSSGNRWLQSECEITSWNALRTTFCSSLFLQAREASQRMGFDPALCRGEETDFILRLLATGLRGRFDRSLFIHHPRRDMLSGTVSRERARSYGAGMGRLVRRHSLIALWTLLVTYDLVRAFFVSLRGRFSDAAFCFAHAEGLLLGFLRPGGVYE